MGQLHSKLRRGHLAQFLHILGRQRAINYVERSRRALCKCWLLVRDTHLSLAFVLTSSARAALTAALMAKATFCDMHSGGSPDAMEDKKNITSCRKGIHYATPLSPTFRAQHADGVGRIRQQRDAKVNGDVRYGRWLVLPRAVCHNQTARRVVQHLWKATERKRFKIWAQRSDPTPLFSAPTSSDKKLPIPIMKPPSAWPMSTAGFSDSPQSSSKSTRSTCVSPVSTSISTSVATTP